MLRPFALITLASHPLPLEPSFSAPSDNTVIQLPQWRQRHGARDSARHDEAKEDYSLWEQSAV